MTVLMPVEKIFWN